MPRTPPSTPSLEMLDLLSKRATESANKLDAIVRTMKAKDTGALTFAGMPTAIKGVSSLEYVVSQLEKAYRDWEMSSAGEKAKKVVSPEGTQGQKSVGKKRVSGTRKTDTNSI